MSIQRVPPRYSRQGEILRWLCWNKTGRKGPFRSPLIREVEMDITTKCSALLACRGVCTYTPSRGLNHTMDVELGRRIIAETRSLGFDTISFSGGGEPLEPESQPTFFKLLREARLQGFKTLLITNGMFLSNDILPDLFDCLYALRISVALSPEDNPHLSTVIENISNSIFSRAETLISISLLIPPGMDEGYFAKIVDALSALILRGASFIRVKPAHIINHREGSFARNISDYIAVIEFIEGLRLPGVVVIPSSREIAYFLENRNIQYPFCYNSDFLPFNIGADGKVYACCEKKYDSNFLRGDFNSQTAEEILENIHREPQKVRAECFRRCHGDYANINMQNFINYINALFA